MSLIIKNGRIMDPVTGTNETADVTIADGRIVKIGHAEDTGADRVIDAEGMIVAPGLMDAHVHFRDPGQTYKEDIVTGCRAAAKGGFTRVLCMANTKPPVDTTETLRYCLERGRQTGIRMEQAACLTACCQAGIEFVLAGEHAWPEDYPEPTTEITVTGRLEEYDEDGVPYLHLVDAELIALPAE